MFTRLLILGTGGRANAHAIEFGKIDGVEIVCAVDADPVRAKAFAAKYYIEHTFTSLEEAIGWGQFDAAANVTSDRSHYPTTMALIAARKHVLCEKPLAENYAQAQEMAAASESAGLIAMVNFSFRDDAPLQRAREIVLLGQIGRVRHVDESFLQSWLVHSDWRNEPKLLWRLSTKHGSNGVLGDLGIHVLDCAAFAADSAIERVFARLKAFEKVRDNRVGEYELYANDSLGLTVELENGAIGVIQASRWATGYTNELELRLFGDKGALEVLSTLEGSTLRACLGENVPLDVVYPLVFFDAIRVKIRDEGFVRNKAVYIALGILPDGTKEILSIWIEQTEGAKFWLRVMNELKSRGGADVLIAVVDGLKGFPEAINAVFPQTVVQTCIVHLIRHSLEFVSWKDRKPVVPALRAIYRAKDAEAGMKALEEFEAGYWGQRYPAITQSWRRNWQHVVPFFAFPESVRRIIYTTNAIEALNSKLRRAVRTRGHFPSDDAAMKLLYLVLNHAAEEWKRPPREWFEAKTQFAVVFGERFVSQ